MALEANRGQMASLSLLPFLRSALTDLLGWSSFLPPNTCLSISFLSSFSGSLFCLGISLFLMVGGGDLAGTVGAAQEVGDTPLASSEL